MKLKWNKEISALRRNRTAVFSEGNCGIYKIVKNPWSIMQKKTEYILSKYTDKDDRIGKLISGFSTMVKAKHVAQHLEDK